MNKKNLSFISLFSLYPNKICYADIKNQDVISKVKNYEENDKNITEGYIHIPDVIILDDSNNPESSKKVESYSDTTGNSSLYFKEIVDNENNSTKIILGQNGNNGIVEFKHNSDTFTVTNGDNTIEYNVNDFIADETFEEEILPTPSIDKTISPTIKPKLENTIKNSQSISVNMEEPQFNPMSIETSKNTLKSSNSVPNEIYGQIGNPYDDRLMANQKFRVNNLPIIAYAYEDYGYTRDKYAKTKFYVTQGISVIVGVLGLVTG